MRCAGAVLALLLAGCAPGFEPRPRAQESPEPVPGSWALALQARSAARGRVGEERARADARLLEAYRVARADARLPRRRAAEAAFRAGELLRSAGRAEEARREFEHARRLGRGSEWAARAMLEVGHLDRRAGRSLAALGAYAAIPDEPAAAPRHRELALYWAGRCHAALDRPVDARRNWRRVALSAEDPLVCIRAFDAWIASLAEGGDLEEAAGVLEQCRTRVRERASEASELGRRVRAALERMRSPAILARAVRERRQGAEGTREEGGSPEPPAIWLRAPERR